MSQLDGQRYSQTYLERGDPKDDSKRARRRIYRLFLANSLDEHVNHEEIELCTGAVVPTGFYGPEWLNFFEECPLRDLLDSVTIIARNAAKRGRSGAWIKNIEAIFREEHLRYRVDERGGVHLAVDAEFVHNQDSAIASLASVRYEAARAHFSSSQDALNRDPPSTRDAIRHMFEAAETIFKLMFPSCSRLETSEAKRRIPQIIDENLEGSEKNAAKQLLESFGSWITSAHQYRHAQGVEAPDQPSLTTAILSVSLGTSFVRWLAELDGRMIARLG